MNWLLSEFLRNRLSPLYITCLSLEIAVKTASVVDRLNGFDVI